MGRRNNASFDEILLTKTKAMICRALEELNKHNEIEHAQALYSKDTVDRWECNNMRSGNSSSSSSRSSNRTNREKVKWPVTYEHFVENLDCQDRFVKNLSELLVGETIRKAIYNTLSRAEESKSVWDASPSISERLELGWQHKWEQSQKTKREIDKVTRASRRSSSWDDIYTLSSSSSSESESILDDTMTVARAPPSVFMYRQNERIVDEGTTTRPTRAERSGALQRSSLLAERATVARARQQFLQDSRQWRHARRNRLEDSGRSQMERLQRQASSNNLAEHAARASLSNSALPTLSTSSQNQDDPTDSLIHRFLTQPFPSDARANDSASGTVQRANLASLAAVSVIDSGTGTENSVDTSRLLSNIDPAALNLDSAMISTQSNQRPHSRLGEFERFASLRRHNHRSREEAMNPRRSQVQSPTTEELAREEDTYYRALDTLWQADETIRMVTQGTQSANQDSSSSTSAPTLRARRYRLPSLSEGRPTVRLPSRAARREDDNSA